MKTLDILNLLKNNMKVGVFSTLDENNKPHARYIHIGAANEHGIFFMTGNTTNFYKQLSQNPHVAVTAMQEDGYLIHVIRIEGVAKEVGKERLKELLQDNPYYQHVYPNDEDQDTVRVFHLYAGDGFYQSLTQGHKYVFKIEETHTRSLT